MSDKVLGTATVPAPGYKAARRGRWVGVGLFGLLYRVKVHNAEFVPRDDSVLFASNHTGFIDGPLLVGKSPIPVHFLVKKEMFKGPIGWILRWSGHIPIDRKGDRTALGVALSVLRRGGAVGVFPEGTRGNGDVSQVHGGIAYLAMRSGAPVVPVAVFGTRRKGKSPSSLPLPLSRLHVVFGEPQRLDAPAGARGRTALNAITEQIRVALSQHVVQAARQTKQELPDAPLSQAEISRTEGSAEPPANSIGDSS